MHAVKWVSLLCRFNRAFPMCHKKIANLLVIVQVSFFAWVSFFFFFYSRLLFCCIISAAYHTCVYFNSWFPRLPYDNSLRDLTYSYCFWSIMDILGVYSKYVQLVNALLNTEVYLQGTAITCTQSKTYCVAALHLPTTGRNDNAD